MSLVLENCSAIASAAFDKFKSCSNLFNVVCEFKKLIASLNPFTPSNVNNLSALLGNIKKFSLKFYNNFSIFLEYCLGCVLAAFISDIILDSFNL